MNNDILDFQIDNHTGAIIKVIGVGGGGGNAVNHMYEEGIHDVSFALCNTDNQALMQSPVPVKVQLGQNTTGGLGAGNQPDIAQKAAEESIHLIEELQDDTRMFSSPRYGWWNRTGALPWWPAWPRGWESSPWVSTIPFVFEEPERSFKPSRVWRRSQERGCVVGDKQ